eukprot:gene11327-23706_t
METRPRSRSSETCRPRSKSAPLSYAPPIRKPSSGHFCGGKRCLLCSIFFATSVSVMFMIHLIQEKSIYGLKYEILSNIRVAPWGSNHLLHNRITNEQRNPYLLGHLNFCQEEYCWPRMFILGAAKSGTTSLWALLRAKARGLCAATTVGGDPKWYRKEGTFFNIDSYFYKNHTAKIQYKLHYLHRYPKKNCNLPSKDSFLDATPSYLYHPYASSRMKNTYQHIPTNNIRFTVVLREPSSRDLSWYRVDLKLNTSNWKGIPKENETVKKKLYLQFKPFCSTIKLLSTFYTPYNDMLLTLLRRTSAFAPPMEPFFKGFEPSEYPTCLH